MASETQPQETQQAKPVLDNTLLINLSAIGGVGITLIVIALGIGVVGGEAVDSRVVGMGVLAGILLLVFAIVAWTGYVQPYKHFDDINQPLDDGHGHGHGHDEHAEHDEHGADESAHAKH